MVRTFPADFRRYKGGALSSKIHICPRVHQTSNMADFETILEKSRAFSKKPPTEVYLEFYGLYKQIHDGDINIEKPADAEGAGKYDAWFSRKGLSVDDAKAAYIALYKKYEPIYA